MSHSSPRITLLRSFAVLASCGVLSPALGGCDNDDDASDHPPNASGAEAGGDSTKGMGAPGALCDALALVKQRCAACHDGQGTGPMKLLAYEDFVAEAPVTKGKKVWEVVKARIHDASKPMPPTGQLAASELAALDVWLDSGAPPGDNSTCAGQDPPTSQSPATWPPVGAERCEKLVAYQAQPGDSGIAIEKNSEPHPQFFFDAPWGDQPVHALGFKPILDNRKVLHHWILYPASAGPLGGMVVGWAPGGENGWRPLPEDVGVSLPSGPRALRLDLHYYNLGDSSQDEVDASGVEICWTSQLRAKTASIFMQFGSLTIDIPPLSRKDVVSHCIVQTTDGQPVYLMTTSPHAHNLARHMTFTVERNVNGTIQTETMYDNSFNFNEQQARIFERPLELRPGDKVITRCTYENNTTQRVVFGENTGNEMCFNYAMYYPSPNLSCAPGTGVFTMGP